MIEKFNREGLAVPRSTASGQSGGSKDSMIFWLLRMWRSIGCASHIAGNKRACGFENRHDGDQKVGIKEAKIGK
jgi:hypothetical protein